MDFITAYFAIGYNEINAESTRQKFSSSLNNIVESSTSEKIKAPTYAFAFGLYAGEKFVFIDTRIFYLKGKTEETNLFSQQKEFEHWLLILSIGVGF